MSLEPISNDIILKVERLIKQGATYKEIKEICHISDGTIAKIKQGKITSSRVFTPSCSSREEELSYLYTSTKKELTKCENDYNILLNDFNNKTYELEQLKNKYENLQQLYEDKKIQLKNRDDIIDRLNSNLRELEDIKHNNPYEEVDDLFKEAPEPQNDKMNSFGNPRAKRTIKKSDIFF